MFTICKNVFPWRPPCGPCLDHHHVLGLLDYFEDGRYFYFVSRYSESGDVMSWFSAGKSMSSSRAKRWTFQLVTAMKYLKDLGYVHGDIKFKNLLIENDRIKLCDFGCVQPLSRTVRGSTARWAISLRRC